MPWRGSEDVRLSEQELALQEAQWALDCQDDFALARVWRATLANAYEPAKGIADRAALAFQRRDQVVRLQAALASGDQAAIADAYDATLLDACAQVSQVDRLRAQQAQRYREVAARQRATQEQRDRDLAEVRARLQATQGEPDLDRFALSLDPFTYRRLAALAPEDQELLERAQAHRRALVDRWQRALRQDY